MKNLYKKAIAYITLMGAAAGIGAAAPQIADAGVLDGLFHKKPIVKTQAPNESIEGMLTGAQEQLAEKITSYESKIKKLEDKYAPLQKGAEEGMNSAKDDFERIKTVINDNKDLTPELKDLAIKTVEATYQNNLLKYNKQIAEMKAEGDYQKLLDLKEKYNALKLKAAAIKQVLEDQDTKNVINLEKLVSDKPSDK